MSTIIEVTVTDGPTLDITTGENPIFVIDNVALVGDKGDSGGGIATIVPGSGIAVDDTDPLNPIVSATGSGVDWGDIGGTLSDQTDLQTALNAKQTGDADLTTIAAIDSSVAGVLATDGAGWIRKTYAQLKTALALVKGDVGLGNVDNTSDVNKPVSTAQQTAIDAKVADVITNGVTTIAPSENAVFDALALKEDLTNKDTTTTLGTSDTKYPSQKAVKTYVDTVIAGGVKYKGTWNAATNSPTLADGSGTTGDEYKVTVAGTQNLGSGAISFAIGDYVLYNGTTWEKVDTTDQVTSVHGRQGAVVAVAGDYTAAQITNTPAGTIAATTVQDALNELDNSNVPIGGVIFWAGLIAALSAYPNWAFCDGTNGTPDLRDKFIVGAKQDSGGVAKSNVEGSLKQTGGVTGHSHSAHANLTHVGGSVANHTGLTHSVGIANHPDLTHAALSHAASTFSHADHSVPSQSHTHAGQTLTMADHSMASFSGTQPSTTHATIDLANDGSLVLSVPTTGTARTFMTRGTSAIVVTTFGLPSGTHTHGASTLTHLDPTMASLTGTTPAATYTHADHSFPSLSHQDIGTHKATDYGVHTLTQPADHGSAGTLTHSFTQPDVHTISDHDTVLSLPNYYALAPIQRVA